jgi:hypothetical protein
MSLYISADRLKRALNKLACSRVKQGRLFDFLIVKRTLEIKGANTVAITTSEPAYVSALEEIGSIRDATGEYVNEKFPYLNFFATEEARSGYRSPKYKSNGTNTTIAGDQWQRHVIQFDDEKPRKMSFAPGYEGHLAELLLTNNPKDELPNLTETAIWYFRGQDLDAVVGKETDAKKRLQLLTNEFAKRTGLTPAEITAVFDESIDDTEETSQPAFVASAPAPSEYLPGKIVPTSKPASATSSAVSLGLVTALSAKNFVILTGPSGTGKSRAALKLAEGLQTHYGDTLTLPIFELVPVGPDWTSPKRLLGFKTPFGKERRAEDGAITNDSYEITSTIRLILRASHPDSAEVPHFLIFDEMNLSHVERYFAPFLSLMEAANILDDEGGVSLIDADDLSLVSQILEDEDSSSREAEAAKKILTDGRSFVLPPNLFFVGTVNVDETTYMFSPKVLDRAHVIELDAAKPSTYLKAEAAPDVSDQVSVSVADEILRNSIEARKAQRYELSNPAEIIDVATDFGLDEGEISTVKEAVICSLDGCYELLSPVGYPFGYRISKEVFVYVLTWIGAQHASGVDKETVLETWPQALDKALLQKVLPKIHGNKRLLGDCLSAVSAFLGGGHTGSNPPASYKLGLGTVVGVGEANRLQLPGKNPFLPLSRRKLDSMQDRLNATGYVSFVS